MSIQVYVTNKDVDSVSSLKIEEEEELLATLGSKEDALAVQLQELFHSVRQAMIPSIETESKLNIEVTGTINLKASGGLKYLFFNVGGEAGKTGTMKVSLATTLKPD
jgi:hypothetical protein